MDLQVFEDGRRVLSEPSETIVVWTEPVVAAVAEEPKIIPGNIVEGESFQVLCIGYGNPTPSVALYLDGHRVRYILV